MKRHIIAAILAWFVSSALFTWLWVWQEGWVWYPAPTHWWWWAGQAFLIGFGLGQHTSEWRARRRARFLADIECILREQAEIETRR